MLNFFRFSVNLATASGVWYWLVLFPPLTATISRSCGKVFGSNLCLKWIVFLFSVGIILSVNVEQRVGVKLCVKLGKCATETHGLLKKVCGDECLSGSQVYGDECLSGSQVYGDEFLSGSQVYGDECLSGTEVCEWFKRSKGGREEI